MASYIIIPCRYASSRLPGKALINLFGKTLIRWVYEGASTAKGIDDIFVATDDERIERECQSFGAKVIKTSPNHLSGTDRIAEACRKLGLRDTDIVVNVQGDEPLVEGGMIDILVKTLEQMPLEGMVTLAYKSSSEEDYENPNVVKVVVDKSGKALYFSRSPIPFFRNRATNFSFWKHLGYYAYRYGFLKKYTSWPPGILEQFEQLEQLRALERGYPIFVVESPKDTIGIDTIEDVEKFIKQLGSVHP